MYVEYYILNTFLNVSEFSNKKTNDIKEVGLTDNSDKEYVFNKDNTYILSNVGRTAFRVLG